MGKRKAKAEHRAVTRGMGFTGLPHVVQDSPAYHKLNDRARAVLFEIIRAFNGYNNGHIGISVRKIAEKLNTQNYGSISRAIGDLIKHGLIDISTEGDRRQRLAREYRLTFVSTGENNRHVQATEEYRHWTPEKEKSGAEASSAETHKTAETYSAGASIAAETSSAEPFSKARKCTNLPKEPAEASSSHIEYHTLSSILRREAVSLHGEIVPLIRKSSARADRVRRQAAA